MKKFIPLSLCIFTLLTGCTSKEATSQKPLLLVESPANILPLQEVVSVPELSVDNFKYEFVYSNKYQKNLLLLSYTFTNHSDQELNTFRTISLAVNQPYDQNWAAQNPFTPLTPASDSNIIDYDANVFVLPGETINCYQLFELNSLEDIGFEVNPATAEFSLYAGVLDMSPYQDLDYHASLDNLIFYSN